MPLELDEVKEVKSALGGTVNDVVLAVDRGRSCAACSSIAAKQLDRPLRAMVPVNLRGDDHGSLGNKVTSLFVELPIGERDRRRRYEQDARRRNRAEVRNRRARGRRRSCRSSACATAVHESISRALFAPRAFNLTITNVPGPQIPLYALGAPLNRILPLVPLFADHAIGLAIVSYDGELVFGINADHATTPDLDVLERGLREEFTELTRLAKRLANGHTVGARQQATR